MFPHGAGWLSGTGLVALDRKKINGLLQALQNNDVSRGTVVALYDGLACEQISEGDPDAPNFGRIFFIVEESLKVQGSHVVGSGPGSVEEEEQGGTRILKTNRSRLASELVGAGLNCTFTVIAGAGSLAVTAADVPALGATTPLIVAGWVGTGASAVQCANGIARTIKAIANPGGVDLDEWDETGWYKWSLFTIDAIGVAASVASLPSAYRKVATILERRGALRAVQAMVSGQGGNRTDRAAALVKAIKEASRDERTSAEMAKALKEAGYVARRQLSRRGLREGMAAITNVTARDLRRELSAAIADTLSPIISSMPSNRVGSASGSMNALPGIIVHAIPVGGSQPQSAALRSDAVPRPAARQRSEQ